MDKKIVLDKKICLEELAKQIESIGLDEIELVFQNEDTKDSFIFDGGGQELKKIFDAKGYEARWSSQATTNILKYQIEKRIKHDIKYTN